MPLGEMPPMLWCISSSGSSGLLSNMNKCPGLYDIQPALHDAGAEVLNQEDIVRWLLLH